MKNNQAKILITGVSSGIGADLASRLRAHYRVTGVYRTHTEQIDKLKLQGVELIQADLVRDISHIEQLLAENDYDILINNAGKMHLSRFVEHSEKTFREIFEINFWVPMRLMQKMMALSRPEKPKKVINVTSMAQWISSPFLSSYISSKRALEGVVEALRMEEGAKNFQVCCVEPGFVKTEMYKYIEQWISEKGDGEKDYKFLADKFHLIPVVPSDFLCDKVEYLLSLAKMPLRFPVGHFSVMQICQKIAMWNEEIPNWNTQNPPPLKNEKHNV